MSSFIFGATIPILSVLISILFTFLNYFICNPVILSVAIGIAGHYRWTGHFNKSVTTLQIGITFLMYWVIVWILLPSILHNILETTDLTELIQLFVFYILCVSFLSIVTIVPLLKISLDFICYKLGLEIEVQD